MTLKVGSFFKKRGSAGPNETARMFHQEIFFCYYYHKIAIKNFSATSQTVAIVDKSSRRERLFQSSNFPLLLLLLLITIGEKRNPAPSLSINTERARCVCVQRNHSSALKVKLTNAKVCGGAQPQCPDLQCCCQHGRHAPAANQHKAGA